MKDNISLARRLAASFIIVTLVSVFLLGITPPAIQSQVRPVYDYGALGLGQLLKRLQTTASVLHTGAHPDDEDSGLLAYLARQRQARTAYLALNRGEGGQNVIGPELFEPLGVIRTEELLQARRLDGGEQFFTRVMDYGFSKKREEAARIWGEREVLADMVRAIRLFRPLVLIARFTGTPADGHGQHQLAGYLTPIAFRLAGDPKEFPEQIAEGLEPWQPLKLYVSQSFINNPANQPTLFIDTGEYDPLIGRSYFEIAMEGRSQHKSQEMGMLELRGKQTSGLRLLESRVSSAGNDSDVFAGIDTSIKGIARLAGDSSQPFAEKLAKLQSTAEEALSSYDVYHPEKLIPILARGYREAVDAEWSTRNPTSKWYCLRKQAEFARALQVAAGVVVDALADSETIVAGESLNVAVRVFAPGQTDITLTETKIDTPNGWQVEPGDEPQQEPMSGFRPRREEPLAARFFKVRSSPETSPTQPYWLDLPRRNFTFDWSQAGNAKNYPFAKPILAARVKIKIGGEEIEVAQPVEYRFADDIRGEIRRYVNVIPALTLNLVSDLLIAPTSAGTKTYKLVMSVKNNSSSVSKGIAGIEVPKGWKIVPDNANFELLRKGDKTALTFELTIPPGEKTGSYSLRAFASMSGKQFDNEISEISYPHIQTHRIYKKANVKVQVLDLKVAPVKVGYIMGSGDKVPDAIRRMGLDVTLLDEKDLSTGNLNRFDVIVVGIRASQVRPDFVANNGRLLEYMNNGGTLIVQYQQQEYIRLNLPPYPAKMDSNFRVVDENAPVKILVPSHPVFNFPNKISDDDWQGWVQERNLYGFTDFDRSKYTPLLESHDEGEPERIGGMVYAEFGKGQYLYTSYSWFRQLPAGNPGAYRIFANILSLPKASNRPKKVNE